MTTINLDEFTEAYITAALWSSLDDSTEQGGEPLDANYSIDDIHPETMAEIVKECQDFRQSFGNLIEGREAQAGHDFWLTRCRHGCGFWDGGWDRPLKEVTGEVDPRYPTVGHLLTTMSKPYGEYTLYVGDDGMIHGM